MRSILGSLVLALSVVGCGANYPIEVQTGATSGSTTGSPQSGTSGSTSAGDSGTTGTSATSGSTGTSATSGTTGTSGSSGTTGSTCVDTWGNYASGFFSQHCASCHGTFSYADVQASATQYQSAISSGFMPRGETLSASEKARIDAWFGCGMPQ